MTYAIITGASKGLGAAAAKQLLLEGLNVISVSRSENEALKETAEKESAKYTHYSCDLSSPSEVKGVFTEIAGMVFQESGEDVYLINNAGMVDPIETAGNLDEEITEKHVNVNFLSPMIISNMFLNKAEALDARLVIANVSSGAGSRPVHGWSVYCSTKAAINMFTQTTALELENQQSRHKVFAFSPGIMDTDMQSTIRSSSKSAFNDIDTFKNYKEEGKLRDAETVAGALVNVLKSDEIENGKIYQINDFL
ncbi:(S)-benzoin forming benzil reductase [Rossellomorea vietnamensis]|uniref:(S)-benzoin forming benzil reductase n=1 Tax=Rossellomorea vietnamensis TaxID=218284 RepID=A0A5D4M7W7_9BACI|nr:(S)-benzoin forming benzil reductase [Rossellomorea vietnamensis]TYR98014.1 (S)-benzoin forming benzil reductase [Rossellomorea vietnamensis]